MEPQNAAARSEPADDLPSDDTDSGAASKLVEILITLGRAKWTLLAVDLLVTAAVALGLLMIPNTYTARTLLLPPQQGQSSGGSALATLGILATGLGGVSTLKTPEEMYVSLLKSESVGDVLIERFKLRERYHSDTVADVRKSLARRVSVSAERKSGLILVQVDDREPVFAAQMANAFAEALRGLMNRIAVTEASQRRMFFAEQAEQAKTELAKAELAFKAAQEKYGIQSIDVRAQGDIRAASELRAQVMTREVQIQAMRQYAGPENPDVQRLQAEIGSLRLQLNRMEHGAGIDSPSSGPAMANQRAYREVKYQEAILSGLITQAELARGDEARQAPLVQQVDIARPPDRATSPDRRLIVLLAAVSGLLGAIAFVLVRKAWRDGGRDPESIQRWQRLRSAWRLRATETP